MHMQIVRVQLAVKVRKNVIFAIDNTLLIVGADKSGKSDVEEVPALGM